LYFQDKTFYRIDNWLFVPFSFIFSFTTFHSLLMTFSFSIHLRYRYYLFYLFYYSARRLIGSLIIESAAYCNQLILVPLYINSTQNTSVNWISRLLLSFLGWPKAILLSGGHCITHFLFLFSFSIPFLFLIHFLCLFLT